MNLNDFVYMAVVYDRRQERTRQMRCFENSYDLNTFVKSQTILFGENSVFEVVPLVSDSMAHLRAEHPKYFGPQPAPYEYIHVPAKEWK